jgi:hypothetical protein
MNSNVAYASQVPAVRDDTIELIRRGEVVATESRDNGRETGARALMRAVLQDAILCLGGHATGVPRRQQQRAADQAYRWIASRDTSWPFSFESICHVLGLEATYLRRKLLTAASAVRDGAVRREREIWHAGGMMSSLRAVRMRGNQRKGTLRLRERRRRGRTAATVAHAAGSQRRSDHAVAVS